MIRWLLRLYPRAFRARFGEEMCRLHEELCRDAARAGRRALWRAAWRSGLDLLIGALRERGSAMTPVEKRALLAAAIVGLALGWMDTHITTDDSGVVAGIVLLTAAGVAAASPKRPTLTGALVGLGIPFCHFLLHALGLLPPAPVGKIAQSFLAVLPALLGAWVGSGARRLLSPVR